MDKHVCGRAWERAHRLMLAALQDDDAATAFTYAQLIGCDQCWRDVTRHLVAMCCSERFLRAGGREEATDSVAQTIQEVLML